MLYESRFTKLQISTFEKYKNGWLFRRWFTVALFIKKTEKKRALRRALKGTKHIFWVRNIFRKREELGEFHPPVQELWNEDREYFFR